MLVELITQAGDCEILQLHVHFSVGINKINVKSPGCRISRNNVPIPTAAATCFAAVYSFALQNITEFQIGQVSPYSLLYHLDELRLSHFHLLLILGVYIH